MSTITYFLSKDLKEGFVLNYKIVNSIFGVDNQKDAALFLAEPNRFQRISFERVSELKAEAQKAVDAIEDIEKEMVEKEKELKEEKKVEPKEIKKEAEVEFKEEDDTEKTMDETVIADLDEILEPVKEVKSTPIKRKRGRPKGQLKRRVIKE